MGVRNRARSGVGPRVFLQLQLDSDASTWRSELFAYALPPREQALRLWRAAELLHPRRPLSRGYALVEKRGGGVLTQAAQARAEGALTLHFADGAVDAHVDGSGGAASRPSGQPRPERAKVDQPKLL